MIPFLFVYGYIIPYAEGLVKVLFIFIEWKGYNILGKVANIFFVGFLVSRYSPLFVLERQKFTFVAAALSEP